MRLIVGPVVRPCARRGALVRRRCWPRCWPCAGRLRDRRAGVRPAAGCPPRLGPEPASDRLRPRRRRRRARLGRAGVPGAVAPPARRGGRPRAASPPCSPAPSLPCRRARLPSLPTLMRADFSGGPAGAAHRVDDRRLHPPRGHLPQRRAHRVRASCCGRRARARSPASCSTTATSSRRSTSPARAWPASRTGWPGPASSCCTPTTAATPPPTRPAPVDRETRLGYTRDAVNAVEALKQLPYVDADRLAMLGRSMGGGVTLNALVAAARAGGRRGGLRVGELAFLDNLDRCTVPERPEAARALSTGSARRGRRRAFYRGLSPRTYFDRITEPVLIHHGTADDTCPPPGRGPRQRLLRAAGVRHPPARCTAARTTPSRPLAGLDGADRAVPAPPAPRLMYDPLGSAGAVSPPGRAGYRGGSHGRESTMTRTRATSCQRRRRRTPCAPGRPSSSAATSAEALVRPEILTLLGALRGRRSRPTSPRRRSPTRPRPRRSGTARRCRPPSSGSRPSCGAPPRTATSSSPSPTRETRILWTYGGRVMRRKAETRQLRGRRPLGRQPASAPTRSTSPTAPAPPAMVFSAEHYAPIVHNWVCWAAPVHDPVTGAQLGVIDLSTTWDRTHPIGLATARVMARLIETAMPRSRRTRASAGRRDRRARPGDDPARHRRDPPRRAAAAAQPPADRDAGAARPAPRGALAGAAARAGLRRPGGHPLHAQGRGLPPALRPRRPALLPSLPADDAGQHRRRPRARPAAPRATSARPSRRTAATCCPAPTPRRSASSPTTSRSRCARRCWPTRSRTPCCATASSRRTTPR